MKKIYNKPQLCVVAMAGGELLNQTSWVVKDKNSREEDHGYVINDDDIKPEDYNPWDKNNW